jgi:hypothetical protein
LEVEFTVGLELPPWAAETFHVLTGDGWPAADEDEINDLAQLWFSFGTELMRFAPEVTRSACHLASSGALVGEAQKALASAAAVVTGRGDLTPEKLAAGFEELGQYLHKVALQTQYLKIIVIEEMIILATQIAYLIAMIPWTFGASAAGIAALQVFGRQFAIAVMRQLAIAIATGEVLQIGLDAIGQLVQLAEGWRRPGEWDWDLTRSAAITGAVGGVLGPAFHLLGHHPAKLLGNSLGQVMSKGAALELADLGTVAVKGAGHEYVTDGMAGMMQGQDWRPDTFSLTAGGADEGITGMARTGGRKSSHRFSMKTLGFGPKDGSNQPQIPGPISIDHAPAAALTGAGAPAGKHAPAGDQIPVRIPVGRHAGRGGRAVSSQCGSGPAEVPPEVVTPPLSEIASIIRGRQTTSAVTASAGEPRKIPVEAPHLSAAVRASGAMHEATNSAMVGSRTGHTLFGDRSAASGGTRGDAGVRLRIPADDVPQEGAGTPPALIRAPEPPASAPAAFDGPAHEQAQLRWFRMDTPDPMVTSGVVFPARTGLMVVVEQGNADHDFGIPVPPKHIKDRELDDIGDVRYNALWAPLREIRPSLLTADRNVTWTYSVAEDGRVILGSEKPSVIVGEEQLADLVSGMREKDTELAAMTPEQAKQALLEKLDGVGHVSLVVGSAPDGRAIPGRGRVSGEFRWSEELGSWTVNDKSGRYMSSKVRRDLTSSDAARWLANVAMQFSDHLGIDVRPRQLRTAPDPRDHHDAVRNPH